MSEEATSTVTTSDTTPDTVPVVVVKEETPPSPCVLCGHLPGDLIKLTDDEDKKEVLRAVLGRRPFRKKYSLFNGGLDVVLRTLMTADQDLLTGLEALFDDSQKVSRLRLLFFLEKIGDKQIPKPSPGMTVTDVDKLLEEAFKDIDFVLLQKIVSIQIIFVDLYEQILEEGFDANFYKGAGRI